jgi:hypothetical protein
MSDLAVIGGLFTVQLDFGAGALRLARPRCAEMPQSLLLSAQVSI